MVKTARDIEEAKLMAEHFVGPVAPTFLTE